MKVAAAPNAAPGIAGSSTCTITVGKTLKYRYSATDANGDKLSVTIKWQDGSVLYNSAVNGSSYTINGVSFTWHGSSGTVSLYAVSVASGQITVQVTDGKVTTSKMVTLTINRKKKLARVYVWYVISSLI